MVIVYNEEEAKAWSNTNLPAAIQTQLTFTGLTNVQHDEVLEMVRLYIKANAPLNSSLGYTRRVNHNLLIDHHRATGITPDGCREPINYDIKRLEDAEEVEWDGNTMVYDPESDKYYQSPDHVEDEILYDNLNHNGYVFATTEKHITLDANNIIDSAEENADVDFESQIDWDGIPELRIAVNDFNELNGNNTLHYQVDYTRKIKIETKE